MAENNQNEPTYDITSHTAKKGRSRTYMLKDLKGEETGVLDPESSYKRVDKQAVIASLQDRTRINLFENNFAGSPLAKSSAYLNFFTSNSKTSVRLLKNAGSSEDSFDGEYYYIRAHKKFEKNMYIGFGPYPNNHVPVLPASIEVLFPNNRIDLKNGQPALNEFSSQADYYDSNGLSYDYIGEYKVNDGAIPFTVNVGSLINMPSRKEHIYFVVETPRANLNRPNFLFFDNANNTHNRTREEDVRTNFITPKHMHYILFGLYSSLLESQVIPEIKNSQFFNDLSTPDKDFINSPLFLETLQQSRAHYFQVGGVGFENQADIHTHIDFIVDIPFSPKMVKASGLATEKMLTAEISSEVNFIPPELSEIVSSNNFLELELPNFYNFITALVAVKEKRFDPNYANAKRLSLGGRIDPSQLLLVGRQYDEYQASSQLPPGHAHWDYENDKSLASTDFNIEGVDYWQAWSANWTDYNNQKATLPVNQYLDIIKTILIPYENTNFLRDYNENIIYFPYYNQIEFDTPKELPILPQILKNTKADKYIMRCLAGNLEQSVANTVQLAGYGQSTDPIKARLEPSFQVNRDSPPGEEADLEIDVKELDTGFYVGENDIVQDLDIKTWDLADLINGYKQGSEKWSGFYEDIYEFDHGQVFYVGVDIEDGYPFPGDLSLGSANQSFTKTMYSHILEQQLQQLAAQKILSYAEMQCGSKNYSEVIMFRIHKNNIHDVDGETEQNIWMWNTGDLDRYIYYDTQIGYGQSYEYKIYAYHLVVGNRYRYAKRSVANMNENGLGFGVQEFNDPDSLEKAVIEVEIANRTMMKIVEVPYYGHEEKSQDIIVSTDKPPVPPTVNIVPFKNVSDSISMTLTSNSGEYETNKIVTLLPERPEARENSGGPITDYLYASDLDVLNQMYQSQNKVDDMDLKPSIEFKSDTMPALYEVFRIGPDPGQTETKPPTSYASFFDKLHTTIEVEGSSETIIDNIEENVVYYYTFRARDGAAGYFFSNPTAVYKVEMVRETGKNVVYPIIEIYNMEMDKRYRMPSKQMTRYMHIRPAYDHTVINEGEEELESLSQFQEATTINPGHTPHIPKLGVNNDNYELFSVTKSNAKRFKIRLTSKSTGRKIDFNVAFLRKHNQD